ncbi:hypothetical protein L211DRAFT_663359 [Terfezia boudieri ATCC MYA-4762]|uniref:Uncharacterized protein n=1 Tax=Terfezia boudieri ATCC MYA-4762 TaxID=1051890 RepID=A0A3N4L916_9PEZI|nr:hypothetical protein L211DRAFT_663359 [Terfezia boudieri ATCC MYA-4762]
MGGWAAEVRQAGRWRQASLDSRGIAALSRRRRHDTLDTAGMAMSRHRRHGTLSTPEAWDCLDGGGMSLSTVLMN